MKKDENVAFKDGTITKESLPFPIVHYPGHYGTFFAFQKEESTDFTFCTCSLEAISNYIKLRSVDPQHNYDGFSENCILDLLDFPIAVSNKYNPKNYQQNITLINHLIFSPGLCHECNEKIPNMIYCISSYGTIFTQNFGWYVNKKYFEYGIDPCAPDINPNLCSQEILNLIGFDSTYTFSNYLEVQKISEVDAKVLNKKIREMNYKLNEFIQNEVRLNFNHKKLGETWTSETSLFYIIKSLFPTHFIRRHYRPEFLQGLELDIFIEELKIGIEYQGIQHFQPIEHWGGKIAYLKLIERDARKKKICEEFGIKLIYFDYNETLNEEIVKDKLII